MFSHRINDHQKQRSKSIVPHWGKGKTPHPFAESGVDSRGRYGQMWLKVFAFTQKERWDETELKSEIMLLVDAKESLCDVLLLATSAST